MRRIRLTTLLILLAVSTGVRADDLIGLADWRSAVDIGDVDSEILYAIALRESGTSFDGLREYGPWPWVMNVNGEPRFYASKNAARDALAKEIEAGNDKVAVGMWQIYLKYNGHLVENQLDLIDPGVNLKIAAKVLASCGEKYKPTADILSCYHSGDVDNLGIAYAEEVLALADKWGRPFEMRGEPRRLRVKRTIPAPQQEEGTSDALPTLVASAALPTTDHERFLERLRASKDLSARIILIEDAQ
ncbi:MAG: transglycosylase SLT domain-containing protein [Woeseiaceae bacterium]